MFLCANCSLGGAAAEGILFFISVHPDLFICNSGTAFSHGLPITAIFLFEIISLSGDQRLAITGGV